MKAWVRNCRVRARSCQGMLLGFAFMTAALYRKSKRRGGAGTDDLTRLASDIAEAMRQLAGEIISLAGTKYARGAADGQFDPPPDHDACLLAPVRQHLLAGRGTGGVALMQHGELTGVALRGHQAQRDVRVAELHEFIGTEKSLWRHAQVQGEKLGQRHGYAIQHFLQRTDRGTHPVLLDKRDESVGDPGAACKFALGKAKCGSHAAQPRSDRSEEHTS